MYTKEQKSQILKLTPCFLSGSYASCCRGSASYYVSTAIFWRTLA